jgi:hypothetical protein
MNDLLADTDRFYELLDRLAARTGGPRTLKDCNGHLNWPRRGVYFFFETGENRALSAAQGRVVRIGTHALTSSSSSTLWSRLSQHRGVQSTGLGNHRGSIFRLMLGTALAKANGIQLPPSWGMGNSPSQAAHKLGTTSDSVKAEEAELERLVSQHIRQMPFLWLNVPDDLGPASARGFIERNAIALLSSYVSPAMDPPSEGWLGRHSDRERVRQSGLWNNLHVDESWDAGFLTKMESLI